MALSLFDQGQQKDHQCLVGLLFGADFLLKLAHIIHCMCIYIYIRLGDFAPEVAVLVEERRVGRSVIRMARC